MNINRLAAALLMTLAAYAQNTPAKPVRGPKGGCYILTVSKAGKTYKKYLASDECKDGRAAAKKTEAR